MIIAIDCETKGLNTNEFLMANLYRETEKGKKPINETYYCKEDLWNRIIELGKKEAKRGHMLNVYAHNHIYDFHCYADFKNRGIKIYTMYPFIATYYNEQGKEIIKFLDSFGIYKTSLKKVGEIIGLPKLETPKELLDEGRKWTHEEIKELRPYCERDTEIVYKAIQYLHKKLQEEGITIKRLYTISQIAMQTILTELKKLPEQEKKKIFAWEEKNYTHKSRYRHIIHNAYRGGRVEAFKTGRHEKVNYIDCNSLYPYALMKMRFPNLKTETYINKPLSKTTKKELLSKIGISKVMIKNNSNKIGVIRNHTGAGNYYPKEGKISIGYYTHQELELAEKEGYTIIAIEHSIVYDDFQNPSDSAKFPHKSSETMNNPFTNIIEKFYKNRKKSKTEFDNYFWKAIMNQGIGKFAQSRVEQEIIVDDLKIVEKYLQEKYEIINADDGSYLTTYRKEKPFKPKVYYTPIIPCLVTAWARCYMYKVYKEIGLKKLLYTDTDSAVFKGTIPKGIPMGEKLGEFKIEHKNAETIIWGRKNYSIGEEMKVVGVHKSDLNKEQFEKGYAESKEMMTIKSAKTKEEIGTFKKRTRDLQAIKENQERIKELLEQEEIYIDSNMRKIEYFKDILLEQNV